MNAGAIVAVGAGLVTIGTAWVKVYRHFRPPLDPDSLQARLKAKLQPLELELIGIRFVVSLNATIPSVTVTFRAVNYLKRDLQLERVEVEYFHINRGPALEHIPAEDYQIGPSQSREVYCRRNLLDTEARALAEVPPDSDLTASIRIRAVGFAGKKRVGYRPGATFALSGVLERSAVALPPPTNALPQQPPR